MSIFSLEPKIIKRQASYRLILVLALLLLLTRVGLGSFFTSASDITVSNVAAAVNNERTTRNIPALNYNAALAAAADFKAHDMVNRNYFSHTDPEGNYIWDKIVAEGYTPYTVLGENLAINFSDTEGLLAAWIASPTHRANILNGNFVDQGVGVDFGNTNEGQYSSAVANTFGAQPALTPPKKIATTQTPAKITTAPKSTPTPKPTPPPTPIPNAPPQPAPTTQTKSAQTATAPAFQPVEFSSDKISANAAVSGNNLNLQVSIPVSGSVESVNATVLDKTSTLVAQNGVYAGTISFDKYFNLQPYTLVITATDTKGQQKNTYYSLSNIELAAGQDPKNFGNIIEKVQQPDLYNVFKYIVIIFGALFMLFLIADTLHLTGKRAIKLGSGRGSNIIVLLIMMSTLLLVSWWH